MNTVKGRPNILLMTTDQQRADTVSWQSDWVQTPTLEALAKRSVVFDQAFTNSPSCIPARFALATGLYPHESGLLVSRRETLSTQTPNWIKRLQQSGYETSLFGKSHLHDAPADLRLYEERLKSYGFATVNEVPGQFDSWDHDSHWSDVLREAGLLDTYREEVHPCVKQSTEVAPTALPQHLHPDVYIADQAIFHLSNLTLDSPWFCWISFVGPHPPRGTINKFLEKYQRVDIPEPVQADYSEISKEKFRAIRLDYAASVSLIDDQIEKVLQTLEAMKALDSTYVLFSSDHGDMNGDHGLLGKHVFYDQVTRIPMMVCGPEVATKRSSGLVELMDLGATILDIAAVDDSHGSARSFSKILFDASVDAHREWILCEYEDKYLVADSRFKVLFDASLLPLWVTDRETDPEETANKLREHLPLVRRMQKALSDRIHAS